MAINNVSNYQPQPQQQKKSKENINNCESNRLKLEILHHTAHNDNPLIFVAHLGTGEKSRQLNHRRLHNLRVYLEDFLHRSRKTLLLTEGESKSGDGAVDVYINGKLVDSFTLKTGEDLYLGTCEWGSEADKDFFDSRRQNKRSKTLRE